MTAGAKGGCDDPYAGWHVVRGEEDGPTCIVAGKRSIFKSITRLEWHQSGGGQYQPRRRHNGRGGGGGSGGDGGPAVQNATAWSRVLVAELEFWRPCAGFDKLRVASVHMHRMPAARREGFQAGADVFFRGLHHRLRRNDVHIIGGDFNMSLFDAARRLQRLGSAVTLLAAHAWRFVGGISAVAEEPGEDDYNDDQPPPPPPPLPPPPQLLPPAVHPPPQLLPRSLHQAMLQRSFEVRRSPPEPRALPPAMPPPPERPPPSPPALAAAGLVQSAPAVAGEVEDQVAGPEEMGSIRCDSCGIFAVGSTTSVKRDLSFEHFTGARTMELKGELRGPGRNVDSYVGAQAAVRASLVDNFVFSFSAVAADAVTNRRPPLPPFRQKLMKLPDPTGMPGHGGAHMPLAVFVGSIDSVSVCF